MERSRLVLAVGCMAVLLHAALLGSAEHQHATVVWTQFALRLCALWPALYGYKARSAKALFAGTAWGFVAVYCSYVVYYVQGDPAAAVALDAWLPPVFLPYFRRYPLRLFFACNLAEQVYMRNLFPGPVILSMNMYYALLTSYAIWIRLPGAATSFWQVVAEAAVWTVLAPFVIMQLIDRCWPVPPHPATQSHVLHNSDTTPGVIQPHAGKQQQQLPAALPVTTGAQTSRTAAAPQTIEDEDCVFFSYQAAVPRKQVVAKIHTPQGPSSLPPGMATTLQLELQGSMHVLGVAVRSGCICIRLDVGLLGSTGVPIEGNSTHWNHLAAVLLPLLQPMLQEELTDALGKQIIQVHVGNAVLSALWDVTAASWQLQVETAVASHTHITLGLTQQVQPLDAAAGGNSAPRQGSLKGATAYGQATGRQQLHVVHLMAQLVAGEGSVLSTTQLAAIQGWVAPSSGSRHENVDPDAIRLMACCGSTYVSTVVLEVLERSVGSTLAAVKLEMHVPDSLLPRHHVGGPPVGLLPVTLELWQGALSCVSSTQLLLQTCGLQSSIDSYGSNSCWWWGASSKTVQQAMKEVQQAGRQQWEGTKGYKKLTSMERQHIRSVNAFWDDLTLWLDQIQRVAVSTGHCTTPSATCGPACTLMQQPSLMPGQMALLGKQLIEHARKRRVHGFMRMLEQQSRVMQAWQRAWEGSPSQLLVRGGVRGSIKAPAGSCAGAAADVQEQQGTASGTAVAAADAEQVQSTASDTGAAADTRQQQQDNTVSCLSASPNVVQKCKEQMMGSKAHGSIAAGTTAGAPSAANGKVQTAKYKQHRKWRRFGKLLLDAVRGAPCPMCEIRLRSEMSMLMTNVQGLASGIIAAGVSLALPRDNWLIPLVMAPWGMLHACIALFQLSNANWWQPSTSAPVSQNMGSNNTNSAAVPDGRSMASTTASSSSSSSSTLGQSAFPQRSDTNSRPGKPLLLQRASSHSTKTTLLCAVAHVWRIASQYLLAAKATKDTLAWQINVGMFLGNCLFYALAEQSHALLAYPARIAMVAGLVDVGSVYAMLYRTDMLTLQMIPAAFMVVVLPRLVLEANLRAGLGGSKPHAWPRSVPSPNMPMAQ